MNQNKAIIITAPSGAGKTTIVKHLLSKFSQLQFSVSACTREKREGEIDGVDYYFITENEFKNKIAGNEFIEWEEVYAGNFYGTLKSDVERIWQNNGVVIFDVDVIGALNLKKYFGDKAIAVFIAPPHVDELEKRLESRATESNEKIAMRVKKALSEISFQNKFDEIIVNENLQEAFGKAEELISNFLNQK